MNIVNDLISPIKNLSRFSKKEKLGTLYDEFDNAVSILMVAHAEPEGRMIQEHDSSGNSDNDNDSESTQASEIESKGQSYHENYFNLHLLPIIERAYALSPDDTLKMILFDFRSLSREPYFKYYADAAIDFILAQGTPWLPSSLQFFSSLINKTKGESYQKVSSHYSFSLRDKINFFDSSTTHSGNYSLMDKIIEDLSNSKNQDTKEFEALSVFFLLATKVFPSLINYVQNNQDSRDSPQDIESFIKKIVSFYADFLISAKEKNNSEELEIQLLSTYELLPELLIDAIPSIAPGYYPRTFKEKDGFFNFFKNEGFEAIALFDFENYRKIYSALPPRHYASSTPFTTLTSLVSSDNVENFLYLLDNILSCNDQETIEKVLPALSDCVVNASNSSAPHILSLLTNPLNPGPNSSSSDNSPLSATIPGNTHLTSSKLAEFRLQPLPISKMFEHLSTPKCDFIFNNIDFSQLEKNELTTFALSRANLNLYRYIKHWEQVQVKGTTLFQIIDMLSPTNVPHIQPGNDTEKILFDFLVKENKPDFYLHALSIGLIKTSPEFLNVLNALVDKNKLTSALPETLASVDNPDSPIMSTSPSLKSSVKKI